MLRLDRKLAAKELAWSGLAMPRSGFRADVLDGRYVCAGPIPCQLDGGLKCFGHLVGASGLRMAYEVYNQLQGRAGERQRGTVDFGLTHNLGGSPFNSVAAVAILGRLN